MLQKRGHWECRSEIPGKFRNVVLGKFVEDQLDRSCDVKKTTGYWKFKEETLDRTVWRIRFGRGYGPVVRQITEWLSKEYKI